jgi:excisionase family DNA binding protein
MKPLDPIMVSPAEGCRLVATGHTRLYEALNDGSLPAVKLGRKTLIKMTDLIAWAETLPRYEPRVGRNERAAPEVAKTGALGRERYRAAKRRRLRLAAHAAQAPPGDGP